MTNAVGHPRASFASLPAEILVQIRKDVPNLIGYVHFSQICKASWDICDEPFWKVVCPAAGYGLPNVPIEFEGVITIDENDPRYELLSKPRPYNWPTEMTPEESLGQQRREPVKTSLISESTGTYANLARCVVASGVSLSKRAVPETRYEYIVINELVNGIEAEVADESTESMSSSYESDEEQAEPGSSSFEFSPWPGAHLGFLLMYKTSPSQFVGVPAFSKPYFTCRFVVGQASRQIYWDVGFPEHKEPLKTVKNSRGVVWADLLPQAYADVKGWEAKRDARTLEVHQLQRQFEAARHSLTGSETTQSRADKRWITYEAHCRFMGIEYNDPKRRPKVVASWGYH